MTTKADDWDVRKIESARVRLRLTAAELCHRAKVGKAQYSRAKSGQRALTMQEFAALISALEAFAADCDQLCERLDRLVGYDRVAA